MSDVISQANFGMFAANMALFAMVAFLHDRLPAWLPALNWSARGLLAGLLFGAAGVGSLQLPLTAAPGVSLHAVGVVLALAGTIDGPLAAVICIVMVAADRLWLGGAGLIAGLAATLATGTIGIAVGLFARRRKGEPELPHLLLLAVLATAAILASFLLLPDWDTARRILVEGGVRLAAVISVGIVVIGSLLLAQRRRRELERRLISLAANLPGVLFERVVQRDGAVRLRFVSDSVQGLFGIPPAAIAADPDRIMERLHSDDLPKIVEAFRRSAAESTKFDVEVRGFGKDGEQRWIHATATPPQHENGEMVWYGFMYDSTEQHRIEAALRLAREQADDANRAKSEFLASMSHELRTPLNAILGFAQLLQLRKGPALSPKQMEYVNYILRGGNHLLELIKDVLDLAKIESGQLGVSLEPVAVAELLREFAETMRAQAREREIALSVEVPADAGLAVQADRARLLQVLFNLGSNAIKYNRPRGTVTVSAEPAAAGFLRFIVADTGIGIPRDRQEEVFQAFNRLGAEQGAIEGTGIGLNICQRLVQLMGGRIGFASEVGLGSRFWVDLPLLAAPAAGAEPAAAVLPVAPAAAPMQTVLYIEDNPASLALMNQLVANLPNARILAAPTGEIGVALALAHRPDVIIVDIHLPDISGYDVLARLKAAPETAGIPVVALSADARPRDVQRGRAAGFADYLTKPFLVPEMVAAIERSMQARLH